MSTAIRCYSELRRLKSFEDRYAYLRIGGLVGRETFGFDRYLNQSFYRSSAWKHARDLVIIRDEGCDLGDPDRVIYDRILVHHMNPVRVEDLNEYDPSLVDPEYLICVSHTTHNAIHYGDSSLLAGLPRVRTPGDTKLW